jgi:hypothetical protein
MDLKLISAKHNIQFVAYICIIRVYGLLACDSLWNSILVSTFRKIEAGCLSAAMVIMYQSIRRHKYTAEISIITTVRTSTVTNFRLIQWLKWMVISNNLYIIVDQKKVNYFSYWFNYISSQFGACYTYSNSVKPLILYIPCIPSD